jgi:antitoxin component YwqK of YwqJK toxin-antitoxin module
MDFTETISKFISNFDDFCNYATLFPVKITPIVETKGSYQNLLFKDRIFQEHYFVNGKKRSVIGERNGIFNGVYKVFYSSGELWEEGTYADGEREGLWTTWYRNGVIAKEGDFLNGEYNGLWIENFPNGQTRSETNYLNREKDGLQTIYDENANVVSRQLFKNGRVVG